MKLKKNPNFESEIKLRILGMVHMIGPGVRFVIPVEGGKDFVFEKKDMVKAIYTIGKRK